MLSNSTSVVPQSTGGVNKESFSLVIPRRVGTDAITPPSSTFSSDKWPLQPAIDHPNCVDGTRRQNTHWHHFREGGVLTVGGLSARRLRFPSTTLIWRTPENSVHRREIRGPLPQQQQATTGRESGAQELQPECSCGRVMGRQLEPAPDASFLVRNTIRCRSRTAGLDAIERITLLAGCQMAQTAVGEFHRGA